MKKKTHMTNVLTGLFVVIVAVLAIFWVIIVVGG
jgi:hypothetical protein